MLQETSNEVSQKMQQDKNQMVIDEELGKVSVSIPFADWYKSLFTNSVTIITGCGRSGTSILGKLIGSMNGTEYLFEPTAPKFLTVDSNLCRAVLFEDFVLPILQGRNININKTDESYSGFYMDDEELIEKWNNKRRIDILERLMKKKPQFVIKLTEVQGSLHQYEKIFPGVKFVHIIRNGMHVIQSMMRPNWYTDNYMITNSVDWVVQREDSGGWLKNIPWFLTIEEETLRNWLEYNHATRCASVWRVTTDSMLFTDERVKTIRYEDLCNSANYVVRRLVDFLNKNRDSCVIESRLTHEHIKTINSFELTQYDDITDQIQEPEKTLFNKLMKRLKYS